jgi:hypothetical protein
VYYLKADIFKPAMPFEEALRYLGTVPPLHQAVPGQPFIYR